MDEAPVILLTNDDGIESVGFRALYDALADVGEVVAVAPMSDQSAVGRALSNQVTIHEYDLGYAVEGTPSDCVIAGLQSLVPDADLVVAGCNEGANLGTAVLGRSGTVSAAVEATFFGVPAMAVSLYVPSGRDVGWEEVNLDRDAFGEATNVTRYLVRNAFDAGVFDRCDYLNVNAPVAADDPAPIRVTEPSRVYQMDAVRDGETVHLEDRIWELMANGEVPDPAGTDRRAVVEGAVSVSPLTAPHTCEHHAALDDLAGEYDPKAQTGE
jgi:5'-nucleotidase